MTLTLIDPSTAAVVNHPSGLISVRLADYVAGARGTLSTDTDALAAAGTCVIDEQGIAAATTTAGGSVFSRYQLADDTVVIPVADLGREAGAWYLPFLSLRMTGALPTNARYRDSVFGIPSTNAARSAGIALYCGSEGSPDYFDQFEALPNDAFPHYILRGGGSPIVDGPFDVTDAMDLKIRAYGVTGGTSAWLLETLYLVPILVDDSASTQLYLNEGIFGLSGNGTLWRDNDEDPTDLPFGGGKFSVLTWQMPWAPDAPNEGQAVEFQKADLEPTATELEPGFGTFGRSRLIIPVGASFAPGPLELIVDDFSFAQGIHATYGAHYVADIGKPYLRKLDLGSRSSVQDSWNHPDYVILGTWVMPSGWTPGPGFDGDPADFGAGLGEGFATSFFGDSTGTDPDVWGVTLPDGERGYHAGITYGADESEGGFSANETGAGTDPSVMSKRFVPAGLETFVASLKTAVLDTAGHAGQTIGIEGFTSGTTHGLYARLAFEAGGAVTLTIYYDRTPYNSTFIDDPFVVAGPVTIAGSWGLGDWFRMKLEKRGYHVRARAWADGDTEPSTWDCEGFQPFIKTGSGPIEYVPYPYDDEWVAGGATFDSWLLDPRGGPTGFSSVASLRAISDVRATQGRMRVLTGDFQAHYVPEDVDPTEMYLRLEKQDGTVDYGTATIPYGAHRMVEADLANHADGLNVSMWKHADAPDWQTSGMGRIFLRAPIGGFVPFIYRRVVSG